MSAEIVFNLTNRRLKYYRRKSKNREANKNKK